ncbi:hypothetical protein ACKAV7_015200 [Fusarium commune]
MGRKIRGLVMKQLEGKMDDEDEDDNIEIDQITGEPVDCGGSWNIVWDLQSTHGTRIARQHYAVHIGFPGKLQPEMIATFKEISKLWHQFLEESSSAEEAKEAKAPKRKRDSQKTDEQQQQSTDSPTQMTRSSKQRKTTQEEEPAQKRKEIKETREEKEEKKKKKLEEEMRDGLRKLLGPKATWRSDKQAESMRSIMTLKADQTAINVLPTGAGKSILFMLPAVMQDTGTSIVVVPFIALPPIEKPSDPTIYIITKTIQGIEPRDNTSPKMEPFVYLPEFPVIICKSCQFACVAKEADSHLRVQHSMPAAERHIIIQAIQAIPNIIQDQAGLQAFPFPPPTTKPIPFIAPPVSRIACDECPYNIKAIKDIQKHYKEKHKWVNDRRRGRSSREIEARERQVPWRTGIQCQRFFPGRAASRWFEVNRGCEEEGASIQQQSADARSVIDRKAVFLTRMHREDEEAFEQEAKARLIQNGDDKWEASKWLGRTGWPRHLEGIDQGELKALMRAIGDDEPELQQMWIVFNTVLDEAYAATERCYPGTAELFEIARKEASSETPTMPFQGKMEANAWIKSIIISALAIMGLADGGGDMDTVGRLQQVMSEEEADEKAEGLFRIVRRKVRGFMTRTSGEEDAEPTPMNWIINTRTYGLRIRYTTPGSETIDWRGDQIIHGRIRIRMGEIADILHNLIEDQHGESSIDHSFLRNAGNAGWLAAGSDWVVKMIISRPDKWAEWMVEGAENNEYREHPYRGAAIRQYARDVEQFRGEIFMLMHMLGGQPARSTEVLGLQIWNTMNGGGAHIFIHEGMLCFVTMYHKGFRQTGNTKIIHRYVPREVDAGVHFVGDEVVSEEGGKEGKIREVKVRAQDGGRDSGRDDSREEAVRESLGAGGEYEEDKEEEAAFMEWFKEKK